MKTENNENIKTGMRSHFLLLRERTLASSSLRFHSLILSKWTSTLASCASAASPTAEPSAAT